jgi:N-acyl-D-amino-acid deacylase
MKKILPFLIILLISCEQKYDTIIAGGTIYDGTGGEPFIADIGIKGDTIAFIGEIGFANAGNKIDASGMAVSPGFINMLSWANETLIMDGRGLGDLMQGVTMEVMGEGSSMGPLNDSMKAAIEARMVDYKYEIEWNTLGEYFDFMERKGISTNIASFVGNSTIRQNVLGMNNVEANTEQREQMKNLIRQAMEEGAVGVSSSLEYVPSMYSDTDELIEFAKIAAEYGGMYISHIRDEEEKLLEAVCEIITIAREANIRAEIYHLKASGASNWNKLDSAIYLIEEARDSGISLTTDMYNYPASSTGLDIVLPNWAKEGGILKEIERLSDPELRRQIESEIDWNTPPDRILLVGFRNENLRHLTGKYLSEVATERDEVVTKVLCDLIVEDGSRIQVVYFSMSEENIRKKIALPYMSFCSDAGSMAPEGVFLKQSTHPRAYGSFARLLSNYVREEKIISLEEAVRKLTLLPALNLKLSRRGALKEGYFADIVIFDPETIDDLATFENPHQLAIGVEHVWVNGIPVIANREHTGARPGKAIRGPGYRK